MVHNQEAIAHHLRQISDMLVLNGTLTDCPGLIHGKMGITVFFCHYARYTNNTFYMEYVVDLIETIQSQIHINSPADYEQGIAGIGVGIDYLIRNNLLEADNDMFDDFDQRMFRAVMYDPYQDFSLYYGLTGYGRYWMNRLADARQAKDCLLRIVAIIEDELTHVSVNEQVDVYCFLQDLFQIQGFEMCTGLLTHIAA